MKQEKESGPPEEEFRGSCRKSKKSVEAFRRNGEKEGEQRSAEFETP